MGATAILVLLFLQAEVPLTKAQVQVTAEGAVLAARPVVLVEEQVIHLQWSLLRATTVARDPLEMADCGMVVAAVVVAL
jgi:hypothetical protein